MRNAAFQSAVAASATILMLAAGSPGQTQEKAPFPDHAGLQFTEDPLVRIASGPSMGLMGRSLAVSPDGKRVAYKIPVSGDTWAAVVDGKQGETYDGVVRAICYGPVQFSPDSKRVGYSAFRGKVEFVVVDGEEGKGYDQVDTCGPVFSPDSKRVAYTASTGNKWFLVVDGVARKAYDRIVLDSVSFSPDSKRVAYAAEQDGKAFVVADDLEEKRYSQIMQKPILFSPDGTRVFYLAFHNDKWHVVIDGMEYPTADADPFAIAPDGKRTAWRSYDDAHGCRRVTVDGERGKVYDNAGYIMFSPDSRHVAYAANGGGKWFMVVDGEEGTACDGIAYATYAFSGDGTHLAYAVKTRDGWRVMLDGKPGTAYDEIGSGSIVLDCEGKRTAYHARKGKKWFLVVDGIESGPLDCFLRGMRIVLEPSGTVWSIGLRDDQLLRITAE